MIPAHISRLLTFTGHGMPKAYSGSSMMKQDIEWLLKDYQIQTGNVIDLRDKEKNLRTALAERDAEIERLKGNADAAIAFCPTCCQGVTTSPDMTRDEVIFHSGRAARSLECTTLRTAAQQALEALEELRYSSTTFKADKLYSEAKAALTAALESK